MIYIEQIHVNNNDGLFQILLNIISYIEQVLVNNNNEIFQLLFSIIRIEHYQMYNQRV